MACFRHHDDQLPLHQFIPAADPSVNPDHDQLPGREFFPGAGHPFPGVLGGPNQYCRASRPMIRSNSNNMLMISMRWPAFCSPSSTSGQAMAASSLSPFTQQRNPPPEYLLDLGPRVVEEPDRMRRPKVSTGPFSFFSQTPEEFFLGQTGTADQKEEEEHQRVLLSDRYNSAVDDGGCEQPFCFTQTPEEFLGRELLLAMDAPEEEEEEISTLQLPQRLAPLFPGTAQSGPASASSTATAEAVTAEEEKREPPGPNEVLVGADDWEEDAGHLDVLAVEATSGASLKKLVKALNKAGESDRASFLSSGSRRRRRGR